MNISLLVASAALAFFSTALPVAANGISHDDAQARAVPAAGSIDEWIGSAAFAQHSDSFSSKAQPVAASVTPQLHQPAVSLRTVPGAGSVAMLALGMLAFVGGRRDDNGRFDAG